jgi:hypothetical protein
VCRHNDGRHSTTKHHPHRWIFILFLLFLLLLPLLLLLLLFFLFLGIYDP